jgi:hypothetical protein
VAGLLATLLFGSGCRSKGQSEIEYRGERIRLSKSYATYEDYKNDPSNIHPADLRRVQELVRRAKIARSYGSRIDAVRAVSKIAFPGYGTSSFTVETLANGSQLTGLSVEVPDANEDHCFAFLIRNGVYQLVDDVVLSSTRPVSRVTLSSGRLVYGSRDGQIIATCPLAVPP